MATYHCSVKRGNKGSGASSAAKTDYICREGKYKDKPDREHSASGNMPEWAQEEPRTFWKAADEYERANARVYSEIEVALPREISPEQRQELVKNFIKEQLGEYHPYSVAIHNPPAALEGGEQPHAHIVFSERKLDGIDRAKELFFKRANAKEPEKGGATKDPTWHERDKVQHIRESWEQHYNRHSPEQVSCRSLKEQGIDREPERHLGPKMARPDSPEAGKVLEFRVDVKKLEEIKREMSSLTREIRLDQERQKTPEKLTGREVQERIRREIKGLTEWITSLEKIKRLKQVEQDYFASNPEISKGKDAFQMTEERIDSLKKYNEKLNGFESAEFTLQRTNIHQAVESNDFQQQIHQAKGVPLWQQDPKPHEWGEQEYQKAYSAVVQQNFGDRDEAEAERLKEESKTREKEMQQAKDALEKIKADNIFKRAVDNAKANILKQPTTLEMREAKLEKAKIEFNVSKGRITTWKEYGGQRFRQWTSEKHLQIDKMVKETLSPEALAARGKYQQITTAVSDHRIEQHQKEWERDRALEKDQGITR